jgi:hypothetical protein
VVNSNEPIPDPLTAEEAVCGGEPTPKIQVEREIQRLQRRWVVELEQMRRFHEWLDGKRLARSPCRVVGDSRTGKTIACESYRLNHLPMLITGQSPIVPVISWQLPPESGNP